LGVRGDFVVLSENNLIKTVMIDTFTQLLHQKTKQLGMKTATIVADILCISQDAAYRRIRSPQTFKADELMKLAKVFNIDLNTLIHMGNNWFQGEYKSIDSSYSIHDYYGELKSYLGKAIERPGSFISYGAKEIPLFYYFWFPALAAFKSFVWNRDFLGDYKLRSVPFQASLMENERQFESLSSQYMNIASEEIWSYETLYSTLYQIKHYKECGLFANENECRAVLDEYDFLVDHIHDQAERGKKLNPYLPHAVGADFQLYFSPLTSNDNTFIIKTTRDNIAFVGSKMSGVLISDCEHWVNSTQNWLETCKNNGTLLSITGSGPRDKFLRQEYRAKKKMLGLWFE
jgi:hypothetical protein